MSARRALARSSALALALGVGCTATPPSRGAPCTDDHVESSVVRTLRFARQPRQCPDHTECATDADCNPPACATDPMACVDRCAAMSVSEGFDLDGHVSGGSDPIGCRHADFTSPSGVPGIDNQIATLVPIIESQAGGVTLDSILSTAINDGQLLLGIELLGVDDLANDDCVTVRTRPLVGTPSLGTDGLVEIGQTFDAAAGGEQTLIPSARIVNGVVDVGPVPLTVPVAILDARFTLHIQAGFMHIEIHDDGVWTGKLGGGISIQEMTTIAMGLTIPARLMGAVAALLNGNADLAPDPMSGRCTQVSSTLIFESVTAFVYDDGVDAGSVVPLDASSPDAGAADTGAGDAGLDTGAGDDAGGPDAATGDDAGVGDAGGAASDAGSDASM